MKTLNDRIDQILKDLGELYQLIGEQSPVEGKYCSLTIGVSGFEGKAIEKPKIDAWFSEHCEAKGKTGESFVAALESLNPLNAMKSKAELLRAQLTTIEENICKLETNLLPAPQPENVEAK